MSSAIRMTSAQDVGNIDDRLPGGMQLARSDANRRSVSRAGQGGGRFIKNDDAGILAERLGNFYQLPLAGRQPFDQHIRRKIQVDHCQEFLRLGADMAFIEERHLNQRWENC